MSEEIKCDRCWSLNCKLHSSRPFMCGTEGECYFTCKDCGRTFFAGRRKYKDIEKYEE